jgi:hypothetical protein
MHPTKITTDAMLIFFSAHRPYSPLPPTSCLQVHRHQGRHSRLVDRCLLGQPLVGANAVLVPLFGLVLCLAAFRLQPVCSSRPQQGIIMPLLLAYFLSKPDTVTLPSPNPPIPQSPTPLCRAYITQALAVNEFTGASWDKDYVDGVSLGKQVRCARCACAALAVCALHALCRVLPSRRPPCQAGHANWLSPGHLSCCCSTHPHPPNSSPRAAPAAAAAASTVPPPQILIFRGFGTEYWWVWIGLGASLASIVINVAIFVLAATFLSGE